MGLGEGCVLDGTEALSGGVAPRQAEAERNDRALLRAAREVIAEDGAHTSVAAIAARAGVGIGSLYRRYRTKQMLFQRLTELALDHWIQAAEHALDQDDPWQGLTGFIIAGIDFGPGTLGPFAGTIELTDTMTDKSARSDSLVDLLVTRAQQAGALRPDVATVDIFLLIEQFSRSPAVEQLRRQGRTDLLDAAAQAHHRLVSIAIAGLRAAEHAPLPGEPPSHRLLNERWTPEPNGT
jgi:AcrR family transcriptional regulator